MAALRNVLVLALVLGTAAQANLRATPQKGKETAPPATATKEQAVASKPAEKSYTVPGGRPTPTTEKRYLSVIALPLIMVAFALVQFGDRVLPKWAGILGCGVGLYAAHISYGVLQEYVVTQPYNTQNPEEPAQAFPSISFLVAINRIMATLFAAVVVKFVQKKPLGIFGGVDAEGSARLACLLPSLTNVAATWFQYASLWYVTFPTQMVFKSMKLVPVLICGQCFMKKSAPFREWADAGLITAAVIAFAWFAETDSTAGDSSLASHAIGALMLIAFLLCDAVTPSLQKRAFSNANLDAFQMMFWIGAASSVYALAMVFISKTWNSTLAFIMARPEAFVDVLALSLIATLGQIFIYVTVQKHGPVVLSMIMTTRQVWSVILSCILFGHNMPGVAVGAAAMVFSVLLVRSYRSTQQPEDLARKSTKGGSKAESTAAASDYVPAAPASVAGSDAPSSVSAAFGLNRGFIGRFKAQASALTGKLGQ